MAHGRPLPGWLSEELLDANAAINRALMRWEVGLGLAPHRGVDLHREMTTLSGGPMLETLLENVANARRANQISADVNGIFIIFFLLVL
jgi:hypothetical protein